MALAPLAWLLGYRAHYERYCTRVESLPGVASDLKVS
jgi:hypothetical protein